ncbi:NAD(P)H-dependent flavin oxidoreductase [Lacimicrobium alkaliphilum]|nr:nitronate monooxygenase [Lacimicrobium alkaliphilum]
MNQAQKLLAGLKIPALQAPMFLISGPEMVINACKSGIVGSFPTPNARTPEILDQWMAEITEQLSSAQNPAPWAVNLIVHPSYPRLEADLQVILKYKPPIVITALGSPKNVVEAIHSYGGVVLADVVNTTYAKKAASAGVDGLVLISAGAGGHTGYLSPFVFVNEVRQWWDGAIVLGGGISTGKNVFAARAMGADAAYLGTRFIPTKEALCVDEYKQMIVEASSDDIVTSDAITGVKANWLRQSLLNAGLDPDNMTAKGKIDFASNGADNKRWKDIWAAGQGVSASESVSDVSSIVNLLAREYVSAASELTQTLKPGNRE